MHSYHLGDIAKEREYKGRRGRKWRIPRRAWILPFGAVALSGLLYCAYPPRLSRDLEPGVKHAIRGTLYAFGPNPSPAVVEKEAGKLLGYFRTPSIVDKRWRMGTRDATTLKLPFFPPYVALRRDPNGEYAQTAPHEFIHLEEMKGEGLLKDSLLFTTVLDYYLGALLDWRRQPPRPGFIKLPGPRAFFKVKSIERTSQGWRAVLEGGKEGKDFVLARRGKELRMTPNPLESRVGSSQEYQLDLPDFRSFLKAMTYRELEERHNKADPQLNDLARKIAEHAITLEQLTQRPGIGVTFLAEINRGTPSVQAEINALQGVSKDRAIQAYGEFEAANKEFERFRPPK